MELSSVKDFEATRNKITLYSYLCYYLIIENMVLGIRKIQKAKNW